MNKLFWKMNAASPDPCSERAGSRDQKQKPTPPAMPGELPPQILAGAVIIVAQYHHRAARQLLERRDRISLPLGIRYHDQRRQARAVYAPRVTGGAIELERLLC